MAPDHDPLARAFDSLSSGDHVDWEQTRRDHPEIRGRLRAMQAIEVARRVHAETRGDARTQDDLDKTTRNKSSAAQLWGKLEIQRWLGGGYQGDVFLAKDPMLQKHVALKLVREDGRDPESLALQEARRLAKIEHPNVVKVHGVERHGGRWGLWMDYVPGKTLDRVLRDGGTLGADEARTVGRHVCRALAALHRKGLVHRDVKAANIMRSERGEYILMDFGLVREPGDLSREVGGTPLYMAPELFRHEQASAQSDLYSVGVLLFRLVTGTYPVEGSSFTEIGEGHRSGSRKRLVDVRPDLPNDYVQLVEKLLASDPGDRFQSAGEALAAIDHHEPPARHVTRAILGMLLVAVVAVLIWRGTGLLTPFEVEASLFRFEPDGVDEELRPGDLVSVGDQFYLDLRASKEAYVYVVNHDAQGAAYVLFPLPEAGWTNPLSAGVAHRLPGTREGQQNYWDLTSAGGAETVLVVVAKEPLEYVNGLLESIPKARREGPVPVPDEGFYAGLRGMGGFSPGRDENASDALGRASELVGRFARGQARKGDVWAWEFRLMPEEDS